MMLSKLTKLASMPLSRLLPFSSLMLISAGAIAADAPDVKPTTNPLSLFAQEAKSITNATRVYFSEAAMADKLAISFHSQLLEMNKSAGYAIIQLEPEDKQLLKVRGFRLESADKWIASRQQQLKSLELKSLSKQASQLDNTIDGYPCYSTVEGTFLRASHLAETYPNLAKWVDIGDSWSKGIAPQTGYDINVLQITNSATDSEAVKKPILFIHSAMHAREYATAELTTRFAEHLLNQYDQDADISWIVDNHQVHIVFHMNPDGRKRAESGLLWRKNANANHCTDDAYNRGADLNRNFSFFWNSTANGSSGNECSSVFRGPTAGSEPETQAIENYIRSIFEDNRGPNLTDAAPDTTTGIHIDVHSFGELMLWPWGHTFSGAPNETALRTLGRKLAYFNQYQPMQSVGLYPTDGTSDDVSYGELGVAAFTYELGTNFFQDCATFEDTIYPDNLPSLVYAAKVVSAPYLLPAGPDATLVRVNDTTNAVAVGGDVVTISSAVNDGRYQNSQGNEPVQGVAKAEFYIDKLPEQAGAVAYPLSPFDGEMGDQIEIMRGQLDTSDMALGRYSIYVRGQDANGQWGPVSATYLTLVEEGEEPQNQAPNASFSFECTGLDCNINGAQSSDEDGSIVSYQWDLGDGTTVTNEQASLVTHRYLPGSYQVQLTVTDDQGATHSQQQQIDAVNLAPQASFTVSCNGFDCQFDSSASSDTDGDIALYQWDFADGTTMTSEVADTFEHSFSTGEYAVKLVVTDNHGAVSQAFVADVVIDNLLPQASFSASCDQGSCQFDGSASSDSDGEVVAWQWQVGEQVLTETGAQVSYEFTASGDHSVTLTVTDDKQATASTVKTVSVTISSTGNTNGNGNSNNGSNASSGGGGGLSVTVLASLISLLWLRLFAVNGVVGHRRGQKR